MRYIHTIVLCLAAISSVSAQATVYDGINFPDGAISFADEVVEQDLPVAVIDRPDPANSVASHVLGPPNYVSGGACAPTDTNCPFTSLGNGGSITIRFTDNVLTGSNSSALDLYIFEVGPSVEAMTVDISSDGSNWISVGQVGGSLSGVDIDKYGFSIKDRFNYVRLTDVYADNYSNEPSAGADIDAIGAISTAAVPEPEIWMLMLVGLIGIVGSTLLRASPLRSDA